ncbi:MAG: acylphosphatase [Solirubrobacteraceae bacterium]
MSSETVRRRVVIHGHVQGVFFRDSLRRHARERGVAGWARNRSDGAVEAVLEGPEEAVMSVIEFCRRGPPDARVESVHTTEEPPEGLRGFGGV